MYWKKIAHPESTGEQKEPLNTFLLRNLVSELLTLKTYLTDHSSTGNVRRTWWPPPCICGSFGSSPRTWTGWARWVRTYPKQSSPRGLPQMTSNMARTIKINATMMSSHRNSGNMHREMSVLRHWSASGRSVRVCSVRLEMAGIFNLEVLSWSR